MSSETPVGQIVFVDFEDKPYKLDFTKEPWTATSLISGKVVATDIRVDFIRFHSSRLTEEEANALADETKAMYANIAKLDKKKESDDE